MSTYPSIDLALVSLHDSSDVILNHLSQSILVGDTLHPGWELRVPHYTLINLNPLPRQINLDERQQTQSMTPHKFIVSFSIISLR